MVHWNSSINYTVYRQLSEPIWHLKNYYKGPKQGQILMLLCEWRVPHDNLCASMPPFFAARPWAADMLLKNTVRRFFWLKILPSISFKKTTTAANRQALQVPASGFFFFVFIKLDGLALNGHISALWRATNEYLLSFAGIWVITGLGALFAIIATAENTCLIRSLTHDLQTGIIPFPTVLEGVPKPTCELLKSVASGFMSCVDPV